MSEQQLDLFSDAGIRTHRPSLGRAGQVRPAPADFDDAALIAAIPEAGFEDAPALAAEAGRRRLASAVPALEALCRRFAGYGVDRMVPEQEAALQALAAI